MDTESDQCRSDAACEERLEGNYFVSAYPPFSCWTRKGTEAVRRVLARPPVAANGPLGLYVHIPFCMRRCDYCYYLSYDDKSPAQAEAYLSALPAELSMYRRTAALNGQKLAFAYFGGGTPTLPSAGSLAKLLCDLQALLPWDTVDEATFECAPRSVDAEKLQVLRDAGVTRLSMGVQQLNDEVLRANGRVHRVRDVHHAYSAIQGAGFDVVNLDLIAGLVGETDATFDSSLEEVIALEPDSVTVYQLEVPHNTVLYRSLYENASAAAPAPWSVKRDRVARAFSRLEQAGYSIRSAYAAVRDPQRHRFIYQDGQYRGANVLGLGVAAFSYVGGIHYQNATSFESYLSEVSSGRLPLHRAHRLNDEERLVREFVLQLKLGRVSGDDFREKFGVDPTARFADPLGRFADAGWLTITDGNVTLTRAGLARVDRLLPAFYLPRHRNLRYT